MLNIELNLGPSLGGCPIVITLSVCLFVCLSVRLSSKHFNIGHDFFSLREHFFIFDMCDPCPDGTINFKLVTFTITFFIVRDRVFIFSMCVPYDKTFPTEPSILNVWPWPWPLTYFSKTSKLAIFFFITRDRAFVFGMCVLYDNTFSTES